LNLGGGSDVGEIGGHLARVSLKSEPRPVAPYMCRALRIIVKRPTPGELTTSYKDSSVMRGFSLSRRERG
jgi:hypothetical protein